MHLSKFLSLLPKHPKSVFEDALVNKPWGYGIYIACEIYDGNQKSYCIIFLDNVEQLVEFIPSLLLSNLVMNEDISKSNSVDYNEVFILYKKFRNLEYFSDELFAELMGEWGFINVLNIGFINTFFNLPDKLLSKIQSNPTIFEYDDLVKMGLNMTEFFILSGFINIFNAMPSELPSEFLEYLTSLNS